MRVRLLVSLTFFCLPLWAQESPTVRVRIMKAHYPLQVLGTGVNISGLKGEDLKTVSIPLDKSLTIDLRSVRGFKTWIVSDHSRTSRVLDPYIELTSTSPKVRVLGYEIETPLLLTQEGDMIAALPLEKYLEGVLSGEMPTGWPMEALKAQAVAARSYTLAQLANRRDKPFQLDGTALDQVYDFQIQERQKARIRAALEATEGLVLKLNGQVLKAYYHSDCGGRTEEPGQVWGGTSQKMASVRDKYCALSSHSQWKVDISLAEIRKKLEASGREIGPLEDIQVTRRSGTGRVSLLAFNDDLEREITVTGNDFRKLMGFNRLKSTLFDLKRSDEMVSFMGRGFGHGSGLCQWGARYMAEQGARLKEILSHYYPRAVLAKNY